MKGDETLAAQCLLLSAIIPLIRFKYKTKHLFAHTYMVCICAHECMYLVLQQFKDFFFPLCLSYLGALANLKSKQMWANFYKHPWNSIFDTTMVMCVLENIVLDIKRLWLYRYVISVLLIPVSMLNHTQQRRWPLRDKSLKRSCFIAVIIFGWFISWVI